MAGRRVKRDAHVAKTKPGDEWQEVMPHGGKCNRGGNFGNVYGAGRIRQQFRKTLVQSSVRAADYWIKVAAGKPLIDVIGPNGEVKDKKRAPTHQERTQAFDLALKYGLGTQQEIIVLGSDEVLQIVAEVLAEKIAVEQVDEILSEVGQRLNGQG